ncbi:MAG TPA: c-type cytochrome, partial [Thermodesulfobacteriota bacterium]|nr:c-type cytochrome [Thermodesulfobacteriota bacterium]
MPLINITAPMIRIPLTALIVVFFIFAFTTISRGDQAGVEKGENLFKNKGCVACHSIGKGKITGPDLLGVTKRRDKEWITKWLQS